VYFYINKGQLGLPGIPPGVMTDSSGMPIEAQNPIVLKFWQVLVICGFVTPAGQVFPLF
jgi:hypothetical protein